jgi:hypothetical protein
MGSLSSNEERRLAYFHALSKSMTENTQEVYESRYKSSHNIRLNEVWSDNIGFAVDYSAAVTESIFNPAVTIFSGVTLSEILGSNGQAYNFYSGSTFIRPWISPVDVPDNITNEPSIGYQVQLFKGDDTPIGLTEGAWSVDYYTGLIHFAEFWTPADLGWGAIKATFFQYTGNYAESGGTANAFTTVVFDSGTSTLIFNSGETSETVVDLSALKSVSGTTSKMSKDNSNMSALTTSYLSPNACATVLVNNIPNSKVSVFVNGVQVNVGSLSTDGCYFSGDGGSTKRNSGDEVAGDLLYWNYNGSDPVAGYELSASSDKITFIYLTL